MFIDAGVSYAIPSDSQCLLHCLHTACRRHVFSAQASSSPQYLRFQLTQEHLTRACAMMSSRSLSIAIDIDKYGVQYLDLHIVTPCNTDCNVLPCASKVDIKYTKAPCLSRGVKTILIIKIDLWSSEHFCSVFQSLAAS